MTLGNVFELAGAIILSLGGGAALVFACASWLGKVWANRILETDRRKYGEELERLRRELDKATLVHRVHFEAEFRALSDVWAALSALRAAMASLRPLVDVVDPDETPDERFRRRLTRFEEALNGFVRAVDNHSPFYAEDIYLELSHAVQIAQRESVSVSLEKPEKISEWFKEGAANFSAFKESADNVSALIRRRLVSLQVTP